MKKTIYFFFTLTSLMLQAQEQNLKASFISSQTIVADSYLGFDSYANLYYTKNNILFKKNKEALWQYKNLSLGKISRVDFQNPLKILIFYENFNAVVLLDNQLNEIQKIDFSKSNDPIILSAVGIATQNRLWIYNNLTQKIGLYDYLNYSYQDITASFQGNIIYYDSDFNNFKWIDEKLNYWTADIFGKINNLGKIPPFEQIQLLQKQSILFSKDSKLFLNDLEKKKVDPISNIEKTFEKFYYKDQILSIFTNGRIMNYKITTP